MGPRIATLTANVGGIDDTKLMPAQSLPINCFCFDSPPPADWAQHAPPRLQALWYKLQPFNITQLTELDPEIVIWTDSKVQVLSFDFVQQIVDQLDGAKFAALKHGERTCIYEEVSYIETMIRKGSSYLRTRYATKPIRQQVEAYRYFGYPANNGLFDCSIFAARVCSEARHLFNAWWDDVKRNNAFDQTALPFWAWKLGVEVQPITFKPGSYKLVPHKVLQ